jgi:hypothetical protein
VIAGIYSIRERPLDLIPRQIIRALASAVPLPANREDARTEFAYWQRRNDEIELLREGEWPNQIGPAAYLRQQIVRHLWCLDAGVDPPFSDELRAMISAQQIEQAQQPEPARSRLVETIKRKPAGDPTPQQAQAKAQAQARKKPEPPAKPRDEFMVLPPHVLQRYGLK